MKLRLLQLATLIIVLACGFLAGHTWPSHATYQSGYEQALDEVASGAVTVDSQATRLKRAEEAAFTREVEYMRVVSAVAEAYHKDPSEVEVECGLVDRQGNIVRTEAR